MNKVLLIALILAVTGVLAMENSSATKVDPVIGIFSNASMRTGYNVNQWSYVIYNYVQYLHQAGAKVIVIPYDSDEESLREIVKNVNGILFTGGSIDIHLETPLPGRPENYNIYTKNAGLIFELAKELNDAGDFFPLWGTCQGFQLFHYIVNGYDYDVISHVENDMNINRNGIFERRSTMMRGLSDRVHLYAQHHEPLFYWHELMVSISEYDRFPVLKDFFRVTGVSVNATSFDAPDAHKYVAAVEAWNYPFYAV